MTSEPLRFTEDFPKPTAEEWKAEVEKALKGAPFEKKMFNKTYEGITLKGIYTRQDWPPTGDPSGFPGAMPFTRGQRASGNVVGNWDIRQLFNESDPAKCNEVILRELENGVSSLWIQFDGAAKRGLDGDDPAAADTVGDDGIMLYSVDDLDLLLTGVKLDLAPVSLRAGPQAFCAAALLAALWTRRGVAPEAALGAFNVDPLGALAETGTLPTAIDVALERMAALAKHTAHTYRHVTAVGVDTTAYYNAGANEAQDLAASMATAVAYLRAMTDAGMDVDAACRQILFTYAVGCDQFLTIAKLRAARKMWARIAESCGASESARGMRMQVITAERMMSRRDPWVNMLRTTVACFGAAIGGANSICVLPYNDAIGIPDELGRRVSRNTHNVLAEESNLARVVDPGGGSWYIETRTDELAQAAWKEFQAIEAAGGMAKAVTDGSFAKRIADSHAAREANIAKRKDAITGVSEFPNINEGMPPYAEIDTSGFAAKAAERLAATRGTGGGDTSGLLSAPAEQLPAAAIAAAGGGATIGALAASLGGAPTAIEALPTHRLPEKFEALRDASDAFAEKTGKRPRIFLANLGPIAKHTGRATFAKNFFEVAGIETLTNNGFNDAETCARAFKDSSARVAIICSADPLYEEMVGSVAPALKSAGCEYLFLAGNPGDKKDAYFGAGVDDFIAMGGNVLQQTTDLLKRLGVISA